MELRDLKAFVTLGEVMHFGQAAARQHVTQSALSKQIRRLETALGGELFERNAGSTRFTALGRTLYGEACTLVAQSEQLARSARDVLAGNGGTLRIGFGVATKLLVPAAIARFRASRPGVAIELNDLSTHHQLLALAEVEQHGWLQKRERIAVGPLLQAAADAVAMRAQAAGVQVQVQDTAGLVVSGDAWLLGQALNNLLENALAFSPSGTTVELGAARDGDAVVLSVADRGSGVPDYALARGFERFYSLARPATGQRSSGLGLSFVQEVARLHGGRASLVNREGGGAVASLSIA